MGHTNKKSTQMDTLRTSIDGLSKHKLDLQKWCHFPTHVASLTLETMLFCIGLVIVHKNGTVFGYFSPCTLSTQCLPILTIILDFNQFSKFILELFMKIRLFDLNNNHIQLINTFQHLTNILREGDRKFRERK